MSIIQTNAVCPAILVGLEEVLKDGAPYQLFTQVGLLQSLFDPMNRQPNTVVQGVGAENGHPKTVRIKHKQRATPTDTTTTKDCATGTPKTYKEETFTVNSYRQHTINVKESDVRLLCDSASKLVHPEGADFRTWEGNAYSLQLMSEIVMEMAMDFDSLRQAINSDLHTALTLQYGKYQGGAGINTYNMYRANTATALQEGAPVFSGFNRLKQDMARVGFSGQPIVVGEGALDLSISSLQYGCCNLNGIDFGKMAGANPAGFKYYKDFTIGADSVGDGNGFAMYMPGAMQFASYNEYVGPGFNRPIGTVERGTIPDPAVPGLVYDMRIIPNACSGNSVVESYDIIIGLHFDLYVSPTNMFQTADRLNGVNGVFKAIAGVL
jgi:hypothetical protein